MIDFSRRIRLHREASVDITTAFEWYEARGSGPGFGFLRALTSAIASAHQAPERYPLIESGVRRAMLRGYPYHVIFSFVLAPRTHQSDMPVELCSGSILQEFSAP